MATARGPREMSDPGNVQARPAPAAIKSDHPFSAKVYTTSKEKRAYEKEWSAHRSQGVLLRNPGEAESSESFGIFPVSDTGDNIGHDSSITIKKMTRIYDGTTKFPKLEECAHFHYDLTELGQVQVCLNDENQENVYRTADGENPDPLFYLRVTSNGKSWTIRRNHENFRMLDKQLHRCIFDRKYSLLPELRRGEPRHDDVQGMRKLLGDYLNRFSAIAGSMINCGPVLSWLEMDNRGNRLIVTDDSAINTPAIAAAHAVKRYNAHATDEITFEVGDIISIIDMPPPEETVWWRGKRGFEVGFFPSEYVEVIGDRIPPAMASQIPETPPKPGPVSTPSGGSSNSTGGGGEPVLRKRGKLISFLRMFFNQRPTRTTLKRTGIVKERVFGCDLGEHLLNSGQDVPLVVKSCCEVIESHGIVDGIYRLSGVASNIQKLRVEFDEDQLPDLYSEAYLQDIHSISSLLKMYLRELPNPLLTYQLYDKFATAVQHEESRLTKLHDVVQQLPPPHYRTAEYLIRHLARVAEHGVKTGMHWKNLAIVWAPNLLRSKELETSCNVAALQGVGVQAVVTEYLIMYADIIFSDKMPNFVASNQNGTPKKSRPKSLAVSTPTKLLSLEEARERALNIASDAASPKLKYIEVGGGPETLPTKYHTVIDWPHKKKSHRKGGKSPVISGWRSLFTRGRQAHEWRSKQKYSLQPSSNVSPLRLANVMTDQAVTEDDIAQRRKLRTVKSADSLLAVSLNNPCGEGPSHARKPSDTSSVTIQSEGGMRPLSKRSVSYDMYYSESDMEANDISPTEDVVFMAKSYTDADSHSSHSGWSNQGAAVAMETSCDNAAGYSRMAELEGRFYSHRGHQRHLSDSESVRSQGSYARSGGAYLPSKSPTFKSFDTASTASGRSHKPKSPRSMKSHHKAHAKSFDSGQRGIMHGYEMQATALETDGDSYYRDAVSQILGTQPPPPIPPPVHHGSKGSGLSSVHGSGMLSTFQHGHQQTTLTSSTSVPTALSPEEQLPPPASTHSPTLKERIVKALSPPALRKKMRSPSPCGEEPHSPVSSPPVAKSRRSRSKGQHAARPSPSASPTRHHQRQQVGIQETHFDVVETHFDIQETHFDVNPEAKELSPIGEMLPIVLAASPGSRRKNLVQDQSPYDVVSPDREEDDLACARSPRSPRLLQHPPVQPSGDDLLRSLHMKTDHQGISDYAQEGLEPPPVPPPRKRRSAEIAVGDDPYLNKELNESAEERMLVALGSPQNRQMSTKALSVPNDLQRSRDTLDSMADMGSIGSFNELSKSLDSLLNGVAHRPHRNNQQHRSYNNAQSPAQTQPTPDSPPRQQLQPVWTQPSNELGSDQDYDLQFQLETSPISPQQSCPVGAIPSQNNADLAMTTDSVSGRDHRNTYDSHTYRTMPIDADVGVSSSDLDPMVSTQYMEHVYTDSYQQQQQHEDSHFYAHDALPDITTTAKPEQHKSATQTVCTSPKRTTPQSPESQPIVESPIAAESHQSQVLNSPPPQHIESPDEHDLYHDNQRAAALSSVLSPTQVSPTADSRSSDTAESRRAGWVHAPKASMEETYIDTDSPPMVRRCDSKEQTVTVSPMAQEPEAAESVMPPDELPSPLPPPPLADDLVMNMSISPEWSMPSPPPADPKTPPGVRSPSGIGSPTDMMTPNGMRSPTSAMSLGNEEAEEAMKSTPNDPPLLTSESHAANSENQTLPAFPCIQPAADVTKASSVEMLTSADKASSIPDGLDRSMEDEVFTMDMDESYEKLDTDGAKLPDDLDESIDADKATNFIDKSSDSMDVFSPSQQLKEEPQAPKEQTNTKDDDVTTKVEKKKSILPRDEKDKVDEGKSVAQVKARSDPVAVIKHMSRSYGGEQLLHDDNDSSLRARSSSPCDRSTADPLQARSLSKTPPAVLPKKTRYEKRAASKSTPSLSQTKPAEDSDDEAVKYDDDREPGKKKRHSPKRQKSVKELLSRFENITSSPPKEPDPANKPIEDSKFKPVVFQKPKIVHLKSLSPTHPDAPISTSATSSPVPAPRKTIQAEAAKPVRSPKPTPRSRVPKVDPEPEPPATTSKSNGKKSSPPPVTMSEPRSASDNSDEGDKPLSGSEDQEASDRKVRKLSLMFERRNSARSDSLEPPVTTLERRKRTDSARSESPNEAICEENTNNTKKDLSQSKSQKDSNNEKISRLETKVQETPRSIDDAQSEKENISVRHLSQMFESGRASRSPSSEPRDNNGSTRGGHSSRGNNSNGHKGSKPWTAIV